MVSDRAMKTNLMSIATLLVFASMVMARRSLEDFADKKAYPRHHNNTSRNPACIPTTPTTPTTPATPATPSYGGVPSHGGSTPSTPTTPTTPSHGGAPSHGGSTPVPSHGGSTRAPSHGGGGYYNPPSTGGAPSHGGSTPVPSHGGAPSHGGSTPVPSHGGSTPAPSHGGGGYYNPPSTPSVRTPPLQPVTPSPLVPTTPTTPPTPFIPYVPTPPSTSTPTPFDPNNFPPFFTGTCDFWRTHPAAIWGLLGYWRTTLGNLFGPVAISPFGRNLSLQDALSNPRTDGFGALYREGTASLLNSVVNSRFPFTTQQVRDSFTAAVSSNDAAAAQAQLFKKANEGKLKH